MGHLNLQIPGDQRLQCYDDLLLVKQVRSVERRAQVISNIPMISSQVAKPDVGKGFIWASDQLPTARLFLDATSSGDFDTPMSFPRPPPALIHCFALHATKSLYLPAPKKPWTHGICEIDFAVTNSESERSKGDR